MTEQNDKNLQKLRWMLASTEEQSREQKKLQPYGDLSEVATSSVILTALTTQELLESVKDIINYLGSSFAILEKNGDYAIGPFVTGWCRLLDQASRDLCATTDNKAALASGRWICRECWKETAFRVMESGETAEIECAGGGQCIVVPIIADKESIGAAIFGYGAPSNGAEQVEEIASKYNVDINLLKEQLQNENFVPSFVVEFAKHRIEALAKSLGRAVSRQQTQDFLTKSEKRFHNLFENAPLGYQSLDENGNFLEVNETWCKTLGYTKEEVIGRNFSELIAPDFREVFVETFPRFKKIGQVLGVEFELIKKDGTEIAVSFDGKIGLNSKGSFVQTHCVLKDITEKKREQDIREQLLAELSDKNAELESFTYSISHDLKSPLITIRGFLELLGSSAGDPEQLQQYISRMSGAAESMGTMLDDLLYLSRIGAGEKTAQQISMKELVNTVLETYEPIITEKKIDITVSEDLPQLLGDRARFVEVFQNLIGNAIKYTDKNPKIEIGVQKQDGETVCYVRDNGIGLERKHHDRVFDIFSQISSSSDGSGVGLAIVKRVVEKFGGKIWVDSAGPNQGCTFYFTLPIAE